MFWILGIVSYFVPLSTEYILKAEFANPIRDRIYIQGIPFTSNRYLQFWNFDEIKEMNGKISFSFISDSLKSPEVLLYSVRSGSSSEIGGFLKTPVKQIENQSVILYSNLKMVDSSTSILLLALNHTGTININISYAKAEGNSGYAVSSSFRNFLASYKHGDFNEASAGFKLNDFSLFYRLDGKIHSAIFNYKNFSLGVSYYEKFYPYIDIKQTLNFLTLRIEYAAKNFYNALENRIYGTIKLEKNGYFASIEGKIGEKGVFYLENGELKGGPYIAGVSGGIQKENLQLRFHYFIHNHGRFALRVSPLFEFKKGEVALEPKATIFYDHSSDTIHGKIGLSLFLFKATEARFSYDFSEGAFFGLGVNLFD